MALVFSVILLYLLADTTHSDVTCTSKGTRQHCRLEDCTVEANTPLQLICGSCSEADSESPDCNETRWSKWDWNTYDYQPLDEYAGIGIVHLSADEVTGELSNCYMCTCLCNGSLTGSFLGVTVNSEKPSGKPHLTVSNYTVNGNSSYSLPTIVTHLTSSDKGRICIDATSTGTPDLKYTWYCFLEEEGNYISLDNSDSVCGVGIQIVTKNIPDSHLCILPTVHLCQKKNRIQAYKVNVSNDFGSIEVYATVEFPDLQKCGAFSWFIEPHQLQSHGNITVSDDGTGTAICAANQQEPDRDGELQFSLCEVDSDGMRISAYYSNGDGMKCIICGENKTFNYSIITNHLGAESRACLLKMKNPKLRQKYSCIVKRVLSKKMNGLTQHHLELSDPQELGTFEFTDDTSARGQDNISLPEMTLHIIISSVIVAAVGVLVFSLIALGIFAYRRQKKKVLHLDSNMIVVNEQTGQENCVAIYTIATAHAEISLTESWQNGQALSDAVQGMHEWLLRSLNIDAPLLAGMKERELLDQADFEELQSMLSKGNSQFEIANYFVASILLSWVPGVFVDQLERFRDALANHDDRSNKRFAEDFNKLLKTPKTHSRTSSSANYLILTESWRNGQDVSDAVQKIHERLIRNLIIDAPLLVGMKERELLSQSDFEKLQSMVDKSSSRIEIASYFIASILLRWAPGVFVDQLERFRDALANHGDPSNKQFAEDFTKLLKTPKTHSLSSSYAKYHDCMQP